MELFSHPLAVIGVPQAVVSPCKEGTSLYFVRLVLKKSSGAPPQTEWHQSESTKKMLLKTFLTVSIVPSYWYLNLKASIQTAMVHYQSNFIIELLFSDTCVKSAFFTFKLDSLYCYIFTYLKKWIKIILFYFSIYNL